eukprot:TRINITY_DN1260_c2_g1_i1.p1 TRINITY_DN1260_c2_g1~~TRINITY_DN1260_c2_g1_i1.p1  ORF type:complete len:740 (-),score=348.98 TRINITY_DN1260_c2_g1_i1:24-1922(-)
MGGFAKKTALPKMNVPKAKVPVKNFNWTKIPANKINDTLFMDAIKLKDPGVDFSQLEELFAKKVIEKKEATLAKPTKVSLIDSRRSQNVGLFLNLMKMSPRQFKTLVLNMDEKIWDQDLITPMLASVPQAEEMTAIKAYLETGSPDLLGDVEKYFLEMDSVPFLKARLNSINFKIGFTPKYNDLKPDIELIKNASKQMRKSPKLLKIIQLVLLFGNFLNGGTNRGDAHGFKLGALKKLVDTKSMDNKSSLLHHLINVAREKFPEDDLSNFPEELSAVVGASRVPLSNLQSEMATFKKELIDAEKDVESVPKVPNIPDTFQTTMPRALKACREEFEYLDVLFEEAQQEYQKTAELWGENGKQMQPEQFFEMMAEFITLFQKTVTEIETARLKAEKAKKKAEEAEKKRILEEEKARLKEEERARKAEKAEADADARKKKIAAQGGNEEGIMDSALAHMKGGEAFAQRRQERKTKQAEEAEYMNSIMGTLASISTGGKQEISGGSRRNSTQPSESPGSRRNSTQPTEISGSRRNSTQPTEISGSRRNSEQGGISEKENSTSADASNGSNEMNRSPSETQVDASDVGDADDRAIRREQRRKEREAEARQMEADAERKKQERRERLAKLRQQSSDNV